MGWLQNLFGGAAGAALVAGIFGLITWRLNRKAAKEDRAEVRTVADCTARGEKIEQISKTVGDLVVAERTILYDRIKYLAKAHIKRGWISVEDYEDLKRMHQVYHNELQGNGFLDALMAEVNKLEKRVL